MIGAYIYVRMYVVYIFIKLHVTAQSGPCHPSHSMPLAVILPKGDMYVCDIQAFGIAGDWKAAVLEIEVMWIETVTEGGRRFMAACRK